MARKPRVKKPRVSVSYTHAEPVERIAKVLIPKFHIHMEGQPIVYIFRSRHTKSKGKITMGCCRLITGLNSYLAMGDTNEQVNLLAEKVGTSPDPFFVIEIALDIWMGMDDKQKESLVDHELSHCGRDGEKLSLVPHDLEEFNAVVSRHGLWKRDVEAFFKAAGQQAMDLESPPDISPRAPKAPKDKQAAAIVEPESETQDGTIDGVKHRGVLVTDTSQDNPFLLTIFRREELKEPEQVVEGAFGSRSEAWMFWDNYCGRVAVEA